MRHNLPVYATVALALFLAGRGMLRAEEAPTLPYMPVTEEHGDRTQDHPVVQNGAHNADAQYQQARLRWLADCRQRFGINNAGDRATGRRFSDKRKRLADTASKEAQAYCEDYLARATYSAAAYPNAYPASIYPSATAQTAGHAIGLPHAQGYSGYGPFMMVPTWVAVPAKQVERIREVVDYGD
ncbi:hypothetical protein [Caenibius tardaugens]|uniref:hypothetical protein n=1 Tax=Caenibius tardaugens TaxID=169176 RepID=UPI0003F6B8E8|nr:hypothetical protein [Caenibius tardaugens]AZI35994.1 hypothetical protein EGO55_08510 [Caenibius tardaugens NBRC 16725]